MHQASPEKPFELTIDVEQWRRDIQTFANTTKRALDAIAAELSIGCNGRPNSPRSIGNGDTDNRERSMPSLETPAEKNPGEDRLAKLKQQLAQRISKST